jgi:hypothetical protein
LHGLLPALRGDDYFLETSSIVCGAGDSGFRETARIDQGCNRTRDRGNKPERHPILLTVDEPANCEIVHHQRRGPPL